MLSQSTKDLAVGWFSGIGGGRRQYVGPGGYFSTEGFPAEAYTVAPDYLTAPETSLAEQAIAEGVLGGLQGVDSAPVTVVNVPKMVASIAIAAAPPEFLFPVAMNGRALFQRLPLMPTGRMFPLQVGPPGFIPLVPSAGAALAAATWVGRMLGIGGILGISGWILDMFSFGRIFLYWKGEPIGSLAPREAFVWFAELNGNQKKFARMRMEGADKGGANQRAPGTGGKSFRSKSFWERLNPYSEGDNFWQRINPFT